MSTQILSMVNGPGSIGTLTPIDFTLKPPGFETTAISAVLKWLSPATLTEHKLLLDRDHCLPGSCAWFREKGAFQSWANSHISPFLWVYGYPGMGKSVLAANVIYMLQNHESAICAYFFCNWSEPEKRNSNSIIRMIVSQLARQNSFVLKNANELRLQNFSLTQSVGLLWQRLVVDQVVHLSKRVYIVIDGLDECEIGERNALMSIIVSTKPRGNMSWLIFSHYLPDIAKTLPGPNIVVRADDNGQGIRAYIQQRVVRYLFMSDPAVKGRIIDTLAKEARGVYLWAKLITEHLNKKRSLPYALTLLDSIPNGIEELYNHILGGLTHDLTKNSPR